MTATLEAPPDLDALEALIDEDAPEPKEDDAKLPVCPFDTALIAGYLKDKKDEADAKAGKEEKGALITAAAEPLRLAHAAKAGAVQRSILLAGQLRYTATCRFSKIKTDRGDDLARAFNGKFARSFRDVKEYEIDRAALAKGVSDPDIVRAFMLLRKAGVLTQTRYYKPTEAFFTDFNLDEGFRTLAIARGILPVTMLAKPKSVSR